MAVPRREFWKIFLGGILSFSLWLLRTLSCHSGGLIAGSSGSHCHLRTYFTASKTISLLKEQSRKRKRFVEIPRISTHSSFVCVLRGETKDYVCSQSRLVFLYMGWRFKVNCEKSRRSMRSEAELAVGMPALVCPFMKRRGWNQKDRHHMPLWLCAAKCSQGRLLSLYTSLLL